MWKVLECYAGEGSVDRAKNIEVLRGVGGSRDRSPVTGDFFRGITQFHVPLGSTQPLKMSTRIFLGVKTAGA